MDNKTKMYRIFLIIIPVVIIIWNLIGVLIFQYHWMFLLQSSIYLLIALYLTLTLITSWPNRNDKKERRSMGISVIGIVLSVALFINMILLS